MTLKQKIGRWVYTHLPCSKRTFDILRFEFHSARQRLLNSLLPWRRYRIGKLSSLRNISLNVGSGGRGRPDWVNFDAMAKYRDIYCTHDLRRPLPLADGSVKRIFAEHVLEHLDQRDDIPRTLAEFHRTLQRGGVVRIIVPDAARFVRAYVEADSAQWAALGFTQGLPSDMATPIELINHVFHQGGEHYFGWDFAAMEHALKQAGFSQVLQQSYSISLDKELAIDQPNHAPYSLYVEAVK
jgi:predicted SAM-dependent methyltransferase